MRNTSKRCPASRSSGHTRHALLTFPGSTWLTFARRLDDDRWTDPLAISHSDGLLDHRPVLLPGRGGDLLIVHNTDGRHTTPDRVDNQIYVSVLDLPGTPVEPKLAPRQPGNHDGNEAAVTDHLQDLARCAVAVAGAGTAWVGYAADRAGNFDMRVRASPSWAAGLASTLAGCSSRDQ